MLKRIRGVVETRRGLVAVAAGTIATALAVLWLFVVPEKADEVAGIQSWAIRYGHSVCWMLLAAASVLYGLRAPRRLTESAAWMGLVAYVAFILALVL